MSRNPIISAILSSPCAHLNEHLKEESGKISRVGKCNKLKSKVSKEKDWLFENLTRWAIDHGYELRTELKFHPARKFKFDYAFEEIRIGIEYEGLMSKKSRHTTIGGYSKDTDKYNLALGLGWKVIRVTAMNYQTVIETLNAILEV